jgi:hypothetical protein
VHCHRNSVAGAFHNFIIRRFEDLSDEIEEAGYGVGPVGSV